MDIASLEAEHNRLTLPRFDESHALQLGLILAELASGLPVVINIRNANRTFFHAALPGSQPNNDNWARRKSNVALMMGRPSMLVGLRGRERQRTLAVDGLSEADYADHGGAVPVPPRLGTGRKVKAGDADPVIVYQQGRRASRTHRFAFQVG